ncbi:ABC transporter permease subunit [Compostimonas suwonensis]|uniref:ABC-2 type transport system permease protein n=1 Tax=Compostimonas suwonensis TaxID=1048394 RepID=A0A2M9C4T0_9MICO|nr:ABC transporter permease subunit [Compostimonas suwonensis]PJJ65540.1 ABC-2 type transport system permease protein [Compostimonas suwonensis]
MTAAVGVQPRVAASARPWRLSFGGVLRSEWIKMRSLRSTVWSYVIIIAISIGMAALMSSTAGSFASEVPASEYNTFVLQASTFGIFFGQLVAAVLGVLVISGEYSTGMIRSTLTAVPGRLAALWAKAIVFAVATFVVGLVSVGLSLVIAAPILGGFGIEADLSDPALYGSLVSAAAYLALMGVLSLGIGTVLRAGAGGIAASLGLILVVPIIVSMIPADWASDLSPYLPSNAGQEMFGLSSMGGGNLEVWQDWLVVLGWVAVSMIGAAVALKRRDA